MFDVQKKLLIKTHLVHICYILQKHNKAGNTANFQAGDISRRKKVKEKRPSPFLLSEPVPIASGFEIIRISRRKSHSPLRYKYFIVSQLTIDHSPVYILRNKSILAI